MTLTPVVPRAGDPEVVAEGALSVDVVVAEGVLSVDVTVAGVAPGAGALPLDGT